MASEETKSLKGEGGETAQILTLPAKKTNPWRRAGGRPGRTTGLESRCLRPRHNDISLSLGFIIFAIKGPD